MATEVTEKIRKLGPSPINLNTSSQKQEAC
jgi:hypothetical protein